MAPGKLLRRGAAKTPRREPYPTNTGNVPSRPKRLSRELEGLAPWSGWKLNSTQRRRREDSDSTETEEDTTDSSSSTEASRYTEKTTQSSIAEEKRAQRHLEVRSKRGDPELKRNRAGQDRPIEVVCLDDDSDDSDTITVIIPNIEQEDPGHLREPIELPLLTSPRHRLDPIPSTDRFCTSALPDTQSEEDLAALSGPRCPLCMCPINSVYFPIIKCTACERTYHTKCIGSGQHPQHHPFSASSNADTKRCSGCDCPEGDELGVYCGCPSVLSHRRDQDPGFREYFRKGRTEEAKYEDLV